MSSRSVMSGFGAKAQMTFWSANVGFNSRFRGVKRTCPFALHMSAFDPSGHLRLHLFNPGRATYSLRVAHASQSEVLWVSEVLFDITIKQHQLAQQNSVTVFWQRLNQILDHRPQSSSNLHVLRATLADFS